MGYVTYGRNELRHVMSEIEDLDEARTALVREHAVRHLMAETGEDRQTVTDMIDAMESMESMDQEAVLARVIGDREHIVQMNDRERRALLAFAERPSGSWRPEGQESGRRLTVEAVEGGGLLIRTRPYRYVAPVQTRA